MIVADSLIVLIEYNKDPNIDKVGLSKHKGAINY